MSRVGARINDYLTCSKTTAKELAQEVGLTEASVSRYRSGERSPSLMTVKKLADVMGVDAEELLQDIIEDIREKEDKE